MRFESVSIENFRNFENITIDLSNKNIFFGLNDVGKTNFLYALRYVFDKDVRKLNLIDSDFHNKNTNKPIEITVTLDITEIDCPDCQKLRAQLKGALRSEDKKAYIRLKAEYDRKEMAALPILLWGGNLEYLKEVKQRGYMYTLDYVFNVIYIDSYVDLNRIFKKNINVLIKHENEHDKEIMDNIQSIMHDLNEQIASLSGVKSFEEKIVPEYKKFNDEKVSISIKSEVAVKGIYSNLIPYLKQDGDDNLYPTAGEGRKTADIFNI